VVVLRHAVRDVLDGTSYEQVDGFESNPRGYGDRDAGLPPLRRAGESLMPVDEQVLAPASGGED
jgi:hypothetical protein